MASISSGSGNEKNGSPESIARLKDHYIGRERDMETRHKDEVAQLRGAHQSELDHVKTDTQKRIENIQEESNVKLNQKDVQYQKEIESMRTLYNRRIADAKREGE